MLGISLPTNSRFSARAVALAIALTLAEASPVASQQRLNETHDKPMAKPMAMVYRVTKTQAAVARASSGYTWLPGPGNASRARRSWSGAYTYGGGIHLVSIPNGSSNPNRVLRRRWRRRAGAGHRHQARWGRRLVVCGRACHNRVDLRFELSKGRRWHSRPQRWRWHSLGVRCLGRVAVILPWREMAWKCRA